MTPAGQSLGTIKPIQTEVVTNASTRLVRVPSPRTALGVVTVALITLDNGKDRNPNTFGPLGLASLDAAITAAVTTAPDAIVITGKPSSFAAGADLGQLTTADQSTAEEFAALGHRVFDRLKEAPVPTFALINGPAMGGGLELALHCQYRTLAHDATLSLPEVFLGIVPGWGGTQLLPRLIGPGNAVSVIVENPLNQNRSLNPIDALRIQVVDTIVDQLDFQEQSLAWVASVLDGAVTVRRNQFGDSSDQDWSTALERGRKNADRRTHGAAPAPYRALKLIELSRAADLAHGLAAERRSLAELVGTEQFRASVYAFDLVRKRSRKPAGAPDPALARRVMKVGVIGAGLMAGQLALLFARMLHVPVVMTDVDKTRLDKGIAAVHTDITTLAGKNRITPEEAARLTALVTGSLDYNAFADAQFIIEAVFEEIQVKKKAFAELETHINPQAILATNTSSLSITAMAEDLLHPERVVGFHFFNPVAAMPLLEIVRGASTDEPTLATAFTVAKALKKGSILVNDGTGFVVNRLLLRSMSEVLAAIEEGTPVEIADNALAPLGMPMSTLQLIQLTGPAVCLHVQETLHASFPDRFPISQTLRRIVDAGHRDLLTRDTGDRPTLAPEVAELLLPGKHPSTDQKVRDRVLHALAQEARLMLDENIVAAAADIDLGMITGAGWPTWLGGITPYLDRTGISKSATGKCFAPPGVATQPI